MAQNGKAMPNLDQHRTKLLNLTVLHRIDPFVEDILITASHVTLYQFNLHINQWGRKDVEGSLFVVKRNAHPRFQFLVMNRRSTDNLVEDLLGDFEYEVQTPYLLYRNAAQEVNGIWFYHSQDCEAVANLFSRILNTFSRIPPKPIVPSTKSNEFEELEAVPSLHVIEGPLEPPRSSTATSVPDVPDSSFVHFFSAATNIGNAPNVTIIEKRKPSSATIPLPSQAPDAISPPVPIRQSSNSVSTSSTPLMPILDTQESSSSNDQSANLVKPSFFSPPSSSLMMPQISSSVPTALPLQSPLTMQRQYCSPLIPLVVPPSPPPHLAPVPTWPLVTKEQIRKALVHLVQNNQFIDMVYREILTANNP